MLKGNGNQQQLTNGSHTTQGKHLEGGREMAASSIHRDRFE
jgi:hypothetical protein